MLPLWLLSGALRCESTLSCGTIIMVSFTLGSDSFALAMILWYRFYDGRSTYLCTAPRLYGDERLFISVGRIIWWGNTFWALLKIWWFRGFLYTIHVLKSIGHVVAKHILIHMHLEVDQIGSFSEKLHTHFCFVCCSLIHLISIELIFIFGPLHLRFTKCNIVIVINFHYDVFTRSTHWSVSPLECFIIPDSFLLLF